MTNLDKLSLAVALLRNSTCLKVYEESFLCVFLIGLTSCLTKGQRESPIEVSISGKSMVGFEGLWVHDNFWNFFGPEVSFENDLKIRF